jgi:CBS domain-containing protein
MRAADAIRKAPATIECDRTITEAAQLMDRDAVGAVIVTDRERPVGIVTDRDLAVRAVAHRLAPDARIDDVMSTDLLTMPADADLRDALPIFRTHAVRRIPLVAGDRAVGMLTIDDLLVDLTSDLADLARPVTGQVIFGHPEPTVPAT